MGFSSPVHGFESHWGHLAQSKLSDGARAQYPGSNPGEAMRLAPPLTTFGLGSLMAGQIVVENFDILTISKFSFVLAGKNVFLCYIYSSSETQEFVSMKNRLLILPIVVFVAVLSHMPPAEACHWYGVSQMHAIENYSLPLENRMADEDGLERFSYKTLGDAVKNGVLLGVPDSTQSYYLEISEERFRYLLPYAKEFDEKLADEFHKKFKRQLKFTALVRSTEHQLILETEGIGGIRSNAKSSVPSRRSSHPTGATSDISKKDLSFRGLRWLCQVLKYWRKTGAIEAYDEYRHNNTLHVMVFKKYSIRPSLEEEWKKLLEDLDKPVIEKIFKKKKKAQSRKSRK